MKLYNTIKINNHSYYINDEDGDSCYLIIGNTHALLIDLGLFKEPLLPTIKNITNKELIIVCTHGHFDHIGTIKEFKEETQRIPGTSAQYGESEEGFAVSAICDCVLCGR